MSVKDNEISENPVKIQVAEHFVTYPMCQGAETCFNNIFFLPLQKEK